MISNLISLYISVRLQPDPICDELAKQDGIHLPISRSRRKSAERSVRVAMRSDVQSLPGDMQVSEALGRVRSSSSDTWPVMEGARLAGVVSSRMLDDAVLAGHAEAPVKELLSGRDFPHVHPDHPLSLALARMGAARLTAIPVVSRADLRLMIGLVTLEDALNAYGLTEKVRSAGQSVEGESEPHTGK